MAAPTDLRSNGDTVIVISRVIDAPRELVFEAFTDPAHLVQFWGPRGFSAPACEVDLRVGGAFRVDMQAPDGSTYPCTGVYREIVPAERIVYVGKATEDHPCGGGLPPHSVVTMTFEPYGGGTKVTIHTRFASAADRGAAIQHGFHAGWTECLDRLAEVLASAR